MIASRHAGSSAAQPRVKPISPIGGDAQRVQQSYRDDLTPEHGSAAARFAEMYPELVMPNIKPHLKENADLRLKQIA